MTTEERTLPEAVIVQDGVQIAVRYRAALALAATGHVYRCRFCETPDGPAVFHPTELFASLEENP